ncbi:ribosome-recycling factor [Arthrobacter sp. Hiyo1]|nr:ribosome-recycling factor [Arthrobacter sp. Hiyo1]
MIEETLLEAGEKMDKAVEVAKEDFASIRTGRANPGLYNKVIVEYYGTPTPLQQLASFAIPDARTILITPFDKTSMRDIERALSDSEVGANPSNDGNVIRITIRSSPRNAARNTSRSSKARVRTQRFPSEASGARPRTPWTSSSRTAKPAKTRVPAVKRNSTLSPRHTSTVSTSSSSARKPSCSRSDERG